MSDGLDLERREKDDVAAVAYTNLSESTKRALGEWVLRAGLGPAVLNQRPNLDPEPQEVGALMAITFDVDDDPVHHDLLDMVVRWAQEDTDDA